MEWDSGMIRLGFSNNKTFGLLLLSLQFSMLLGCELQVDENGGVSLRKPVPALKSCQLPSGALAHGKSIQEIRFPQNEVLASSGNSCASLKFEGTISCNDGVLSGIDGEYFRSCNDVDDIIATPPPTSQSCVTSHGTFAHGANVDFLLGYSKNEVLKSSGQVCNDVWKSIATSSCNNGQVVPINYVAQNLFASCKIIDDTIVVPPTYKSCGNMAHGEETITQGFSVATVESTSSTACNPFKISYVSKTCNDGNLSSNPAPSNFFSNCVVTAPPPPPPVNSELNSLSQSVVNQALAIGDLKFYAKSNGDRISNAAYSGSSALAIALAAHTGNTSVDSAVMSQINTSLAGGFEPFFAGGYYAQHERNLTAFFTIIKNTPSLWQQLSSSQINKINLLMKASLIASAFTTSDNSYYIANGQQQRALDSDTNLDRDWNPNYREGMVGGVLVAMAYFGGASATDTILNNYNHASFVNELRNAGLSNTLAVFTTSDRDSTAPNGSRIQSSVKNYKYHGNNLANYKNIYVTLTEFTYSKTIECGINSGAGVSGAGKIVSGCNQLPNLGQAGMLREFASSDANGSRSSALYAYEGYRPSLANQLVMIIAGMWDSNDSALKAIAKKINIGGQDLEYKLKQGYSDYYKGAARGIRNYDDTSPDMGYRYTFPIWDEVLKPFHGL